MKQARTLYLATTASGSMLGMATSMDALVRKIGINGVVKVYAYRSPKLVKVFGEPIPKANRLKIYHAKKKKKWPMASFSAS